MDKTLETELNTQSRFHKSLPGYSLKHIQIVYSHSLEVWMALNNIPNCVTPKPMMFNTSGIDYEFLELPQRLDELLRSKASVDNILFRVGVILASLHGFCGTQNLLHGDFVVHNIFTDGDNIFLIDAHPPELLGFRANILYGDMVRDILFFANSIVACIGFRKALERREYICGCYRSFVRGYMTKLPKVYFGHLSTYCFLLRDIFMMRYDAGFGAKNAFFRIAVGIYWWLVFWVIVYRN